MAWLRTALAQVVAGLALIRFAWVQGSIVAVAVAVAAVAAGVLTMVFAHKAYQAAADRLWGEAPPRSGTLPFIASVTTALLGVAGLLVSLT